MYAIVRVIVAFLASAAAIAAQAAPITYTITTTATGMLGSSSFTNAVMTVTLTGDTSTVVPGTGELTGTLLDHGTATVSIAGLGSATFTDSIVVISSFTNTTIIPGQSAAVIAQEDSGHPPNSSVTGIVGLLSPAFFGYNLQTALGPVAGTGGVANDGPVDGVFPTNRGNLVFAAGQSFAGTATFTAALIPPGVDLNRQGLTGSWFQMATSGQGVELEIYPDFIAPGTGFLQGAWFTYDYKVPDGPASQRWYTFSGNVQSGHPSATLTLYENTGGNFNAGPVTAAMPVGTVVFSAADCTHTSMTYTFTDGSGRSGTIPMTRLLPNVTCTSSGPETPSADFGYSGNWFDKMTSGQGIVMELNPHQPLAWLTWYTYAPNGQALGEAGQRWYTAQAAYTPGARSIPMTLYETTGGLFDKAAPMPTTVPVGTATATFTSCSALQLAFNFTGGSSAGASGTINMTRVGPTPVGCGP